MTYRTEITAAASSVAICGHSHTDRSAAMASATRTTVRSGARYAGHMTKPIPDHRSGDEILAAAGIVVTPEGKARARRLLAEADARWPKERFDELQRQLGLTGNTA